MTLAIAIGVSAMLVADADGDDVRAGCSSRTTRSIRAASRAAFERGFDATTRFYERTLGWVLRHQRTTLIATHRPRSRSPRSSACIVPKGFFPIEDTGLIIGVSEARARRLVRAHDGAAAGARRRHPATIPTSPRWRRSSAPTAPTSPPTRAASRSRSSRATQRKADAAEIIARLQPEGRQGRRHHALPAVGAGPADRQPPGAHAVPVHARGRRPRRARRVGAQDPGQAQDAAGARATSPPIRRPAACQLALTIDRDTAGRLGVTPQAIDDTLYDAFGQRIVSTIFTQLNLYRVILEVRPEDQSSPDALDAHLRALGDRRRGAAVGVRALRDASARRSSISHQGQFPAVTLSFNTAPGVSLGDAVEAIDQALDRASIRRPASTASSRAPRAAFRESLASEPLLLLAALLTVYIVLGVLYESYIHPHHDLVDAAVGGRGRAAWRSSSATREFGVIALIGVILLVGIVKKNAIMMIDFALEAERDEGMTPEESIFQACLLRFRPDHDDDDGGAPRRAAAGARHGHRRGAAPPARHHHRRRPALLADPDALHDAGHLPVHGAAGARSSATRRSGGRAAT